jgi:Ca-activated chloride channel family protein
MAQPRSTGRSRALRRVLATLLAGPLVATSLAGVGAAVGTTSATNTDFQGTTVQTAENIQGAPSVTSGVYVVDAPAEGDTGYLEVPRAIEGSNIWIDATVDLGPAASAAGFDGGLQVSGLADGALSDDCWFPGSVSSDTGDSVVTPRLETTLWQTNRQPTCKAAESITVVVHSYQWTPPAGTQVQLTVWEEPPATGTERLQTPSRTVTWGDLSVPGDPTDVEAGSSWSDAPDISSGTFAFHLDPGSVGVFRMPLELRQHGQVLLSSQQTMNDDAVTAFWATPQGGAVLRPDLPGAPSSASTAGLDLADGPATYAIATPVVNWRDRELSNGVFALDQTGLPGTYYFVVHLARKSVPAQGVDFTFQSGFFSDYSVTAPSYTSAAPPIPQVATFGGETAGATSSDPVSGSGSDGGGVPWPIVLMLFGGAAIFGVIGVVALGRARAGGSGRRRR